MPPKNPIVLTLDAGGTNLVFRAMEGPLESASPFSIETPKDSLENFLQALKQGFIHVSDSISGSPDAISFAFPGPADYKNGIIGALPNLPFFRGGFHLKKWLEMEFSIPVFIRNDADLFTLGEAGFGFLNALKNKFTGNNISRSFPGLIGVTLGTGFGSGIVLNGTLWEGENGASGEIWTFKHPAESSYSIEHSLSRTGLKRIYARLTNSEIDDAPEPAELFTWIQQPDHPGHVFAVQAFSQFGEILADALCPVISVLDVSVVIGGGLSNAWDAFAPSMLSTMRSSLKGNSGEKFPRLVQRVVNAEDALEFRKFLETGTASTDLPEKVLFIGKSRLETSAATSCGAYLVAVEALKMQLR